MRVAVASDHAGYRYKEEIKSYLEQQGHEVRDFGTDSEVSVDYPTFIRPPPRPWRGVIVSVGWYWEDPVTARPWQPIEFVGFGVRCAGRANRPPGTRAQRRQHDLDRTTAHLLGDCLGARANLARDIF